MSNKWPPLAKLMLVKSEHPLKVLSAMLVRDAGMTIFPATTSAHPMIGAAVGVAVGTCVGTGVGGGGREFGCQVQGDVDWCIPRMLAPWRVSFLTLSITYPR